MSQLLKVEGSLVSWQVSVMAFSADGSACAQGAAPATGAAEATMWFDQGCVILRAWSLIFQMFPNKSLLLVETRIC